MDELEKLAKIDFIKSQRSAIKGKITRIVNFVQQQFNPERDPLTEIKVRLNEVNDIMAKYEELQAQMEALDCEPTR